MQISGTDDRPEALLVDGHPIVTADDAARFLSVPKSALIYTLYKAPDEQRYRHFEIPKRTGGTRLISSPNGLLRDLQYKLLPVLQARYDAHPGSHGFVSGRNVVTNAAAHCGRRLVLNIDLKDFFPSINFGRVRGLFMKPPFALGAPAAAIFAQICTYRNGLPQGAPTSPVLSNFIATSLDRRLLRLARENKLDYSRYADDITFSTGLAVFPASVAMLEVEGGPKTTVKAGPALEEAVAACGFAINAGKVRLQGRGVRQSVTGLSVNERPNVERTRIRNLRAMLHAWQKFGLDAAADAHFAKKGGKGRTGPKDPGGTFRNIVYGHLAFVKMVRGQADPVFLKLCAKLIPLDPNPSKFIRQMVFGAADFDIFISHAGEDKAEVARPIFEACQKLGLKAFLDEEHIGWGESFTTKINTALGSARTVLAIVSSNSVAKDWPTAEVNAALDLEIKGRKSVVALVVGNPDLSKLPLIQSKSYLKWTGDPIAVAKRLKDEIRPDAPASKGTSPPAPVLTKTPVSVPSVPAVAPTRPGPPLPPELRKGFLSRWFGKS